MLLLEKQYDWDVGSDENNDVISSDVQLDVSLNCSEYVRSTARTNEVGILDVSSFFWPKIWKNRNCTIEIKSTCAEVSVKCNISSQASIIAVQTVCSSFYGHEYYLTKEEAIGKNNLWRN